MVPRSLAPIMLNAVSAAAIERVAPHRAMAARSLYANDSQLQAWASGYGSAKERIDEPECEAAPHAVSVFGAPAALKRSRNFLAPSGPNWASHTHSCFGVSITTPKAQLRTVRQPTEPVGARRPSHRGLAVQLCEFDQSVAGDIWNLAGQRAKLEKQGPHEGFLCRPGRRAVAPPSHGHAPGHAVRGQNSPPGMHDPSGRPLDGR